MQLELWRQWILHGSSRMIFHRQDGQKINRLYFHLQRHKTNWWEDVAVNGISFYVQSWIKLQSFESTPTRPLGSASATASLLSLVSLVVRHSLSSTSLCFLQWNFGTFATGSSVFFMETEFYWYVIGKHLHIVVNLLQCWFASWPASSRWWGLPIFALLGFSPLHAHWKLHLRAMIYNGLNNSFVKTLHRCSYGVTPSIQRSARSLYMKFLWVFMN